MVVMVPGSQACRSLTGYVIVVLQRRLVFGHGYAYVELLHAKTEDADSELHKA